MIHRESDYLRFLETLPLGTGTRDSYVTYLNGVSREIGADISPDLLASEADVARIELLLSSKVPAKTLSNWSTAMRHYVGMVQASQTHPGAPKAKGDTTPKRMFELGHLAWPVLTKAAQEQSLLTYGDLARSIGYRGARAMRFALEPIQDLCLEKGWPPLTSIVVNKGTGLPGRGFVAWPGDLADAHSQVFAFPWDRIQRPFPPSQRIRFEPPHDDDKVPPSSFEVPDSEVLVNGRGPYQERFRSTLMQLYRGRCALCDTRFPSALIASHIVPWAADRKNRLNPQNGILLCQTHDSAFESGLLQIAPDYKVVVAAFEPARLGHDLATYLADCTAGSLQLPSSERWHPAKVFLTWRLDSRKPAVDSDEPVSDGTQDKIR